MVIFFRFDHAEEQLVAMLNADAQLEDLLQANGESHFYDQIMQLGHPPVLLWWQRVDEFIRAIETARAKVEVSGAEPLPADPLALPPVVTVKRFKEAVIDYIKPRETADRLGTSCLLCSLPESITVGYKLQALDADPWVQRVVGVGEPNMLPIASVFMPRGLRASALDMVTPRLDRTSLWG